MEIACFTCYHPTTTTNGIPLLSRLRPGISFTGISGGDWRGPRNGYSIIAEGLHDILSDTGWIEWGRSTINLPLGERELPTVVGAGAGISDLASEPPVPYALPLPPPIDRRDIPPPPEVLPVAISPPETGLLHMTDWRYVGGGMWTIGVGGTTYYSDAEKNALESGSSTPPQTTTNTYVPTAPEDDNVGWISDVYDIIDTGAGGWLPGGVPVGSSLPTYSPGLPSFGSPTTIPVPTGGSPPVPTATTGDAKKYCYKFIDGQWKLIKSRRRRRRALATKGDLKDLAALKGILGNGKAFEVWIATHS